MLFRSPTPAVTHSGTAGTGTLIAVPTQCRPLTKWLTSFAGRQYRGRTYWPSPDTSCQDTNGHPNAKLQGIINAIAEQIRVGTTVGGTQWGPVIWHRPKPPAPDLSPTPIIGQAFSFQWGTQHRSGDYGRPNLAPW